MYNYDDGETRYSTPQEIVNFEINMTGQDHPDQEWILSNYDTWYRNPYYEGPRTDECFRIRRSYVDRRSVLISPRTW